MLMRTKLVKENLYENQQSVSHEQIKSMYEARKLGYYLIKAETEYTSFGGPAANYIDLETAEFIMYDPDSDDSFDEYLTSKYGEWSLETADKWGQYGNIEVDEDYEEEIVHMY